MPVRFAVSSGHPARHCPGRWLRRQRPDISLGFGQAWFHLTENAVPPESADVVAFVVVPDTMSIRSGLKLPIGWPFTVAALNPTLPKLASGSTPPELGASAITSADPSLACFSFWVVVNERPVVVSLMLSVKVPLPSVVTLADTVSPGLIVSDRLTGNLG